MWNEKDFWLIIRRQIAWIEEKTSQAFEKMPLNLFTLLAVFRIRKI